MAQTVDELAEILNKMRLENENNAENFEKVLAGVNSKLEMIADDSEAADTIRLYISELRKITDEKHSSAMIKFDEILKLIQNAFKIEDLAPVIETLKEHISNIAEQNNNVFCERFEILENDFSNLVSETDFSGFRGDLADFVQKIIDNSNALNSELSQILDNLANVSDEIKNIENVISSNASEFKHSFRENISEIKNYFDEINNSVSQTQNESTEKLITKFESLNVLTNNFDESIANISTGVSDVLEHLALMDVTDQNKEIKDKLEYIIASLSETLNSLNSQSAIFESSFNNVISAEDFANFRRDFADFLEKILDNANVLNLNSDENKEQILRILEKLDTFNYSENFENIAGCLGEIKASFENNSKMNYENIINEINNLKAELNARYGENSGVESENFAKINEEIADISLNIQFLRDLTSQNSTEILDSISEKLTAAIDEIDSNINSNAELNFGQIRNSVDEIAKELTNFKQDFSQKSDANIFDISNRFDSLKTSLQSVSDAFTSLSGDLQNSSDKDAVLSEVANVISRIEELKDEINNSFSGAVERIFGSVHEVSLKIDTLSENNNSADDSSDLKNLVSGLYCDLKVLFEDYVHQIKADSETQLAAINTICQNIDGFRLHIDEIAQSLKNYIDEVNASSASLQSNYNNNVNEKLLNLEASLINSAQEYEQKIDILQSKLTEFVHIVENSASDTEGKIASSLSSISEIKDGLVFINDNLKAVKISSDEKFAEIAAVLDAGIENIIFNINGITDAAAKGNDIKENLISLEEKFSALQDVICTLKDENSSLTREVVNAIDEKICVLKDEVGLISNDAADAIKCKTEEILRAFENIKLDLSEITGFDFEKLLQDIKSQLEVSFLNFTVDMNGELASVSEASSRIEQVYKETFNKISVIEEYVSEKLENNIELLKVALEGGIRELKLNFNSKAEEGISELKDYIEVALNNTKLENKIDDLRHGLVLKMEDVMNSQNDLSLQNELISSNISLLDERVETCINSAAQNLASKYDVSARALHEKFNEFSISDEKVSDMLSALHAKVDVLAGSDTNLDILDEIDGIKELIFEQRKFFEASSDEKTAAIDKYLRDVLLKLDNVDLEKNADDIKETILNALVSLVNQISFVEESEDIKDFVEEKTDAINQNLIEVKNQLKQLAASDDDFDYSYTLQDVESDIARLRLAISNMSANDFEDISDDIKRIVTSVEGLQSTLTEEQTVDLKTDIEKLNEDIISISSRTNKLLLTSDESYKALTDGLNNFSDIIYKLEERINYLDNTESSERIERKIDNIHSMAVESANADRVFHQVMNYLGEWVDSTTENISAIIDKTSKISNIKQDIDELKAAVPEKTELLNELQSKFEKQEERIDRLEMKLEQILSTLEEKDDTVLNRKVDKIEKLISGLGANIEKLTSYVE